MNICIESQALNHSQRSGLLTYTEGLVNSLKAQDKKNDYTMIYYSLTRGKDEMPGGENGNFKKTVLKVPDREFLGRQFLIDSFVLPSFLKSRKCQIFHRPAGYTMPNLNGIFRVLTIHDLRTLTIGDQSWRQDIKKYRETIHDIDICVVVSECTKRDLIEYFGVKEDKIRVIYLGADNRFSPAPPEKIKNIREKYGLQEPFFLSLGSVPRKNIEGIIRGFASSDYKNKYLLVLSCHQDVEKYQKLAASLNVGERVKILSSLKDEEIVALYSGCHVFLFPSLYEGFGLPILEAFQCGAPVITSNNSSCPEVAGDAAVLVDPGNVEEISEAINQLCRDDVLRKNFIQRGFVRAKQFSWDRYGQEMAKVYSRA